MYSRSAEKERDGNIIADEKKKKKHKAKKWNIKQKYVEYCAMRIVARHFLIRSGGEILETMHCVHYFGNYANNSFRRRSLSTGCVTRERGGVILITAAS